MVEVRTYRTCLLRRTECMFVIFVSADLALLSLLQEVYRILGSAPPSASIDSCKAFTVSVGHRTMCPAQFYVNDVEDVESLLTRLVLSAVSTPGPATPVPAK